MLPIFLITLFQFFFNTSMLQKPVIEKSTITYHMKHKLHEWDGVSNTMKVQANWENNKIASIAILTKVSSFNSGLSNRDSHMIEVLDAIAFPNILFNSTSIVYNNNELSVTGQLQFHGVTKQISFKAKQLTQERDLIFEGSFPVLLEEYKVKRPSLLFVKAENEIQIRFKLFFQF